MTKRGSSKSKPRQRKKPEVQKTGSVRSALAANAETIALVVLVVIGLLLVDFVQRGEDAAPGPMRQVFGWAALPVLLTAIFITLAVLVRQATSRFGIWKGIPWRPAAEIALGLGMLLLTALGLSHLFNESPEPLLLALEGGGGGLAGWLIGSVPASLLGDLLTGVLLVAFAGLGVWVALRALGLAAVDWRALPDSIVGLAQSLLPSELEDAPEPESQPKPRKARSTATSKAGAGDGSQYFDRPSIAAQEPIKVQRTPKTKAQATRIKPQPRPDFLPPMGLLAQETADPNANIDVQHKSQVIEETLASFNVPVQVVEVNVGPTITQFGVIPGTLPPPWSRWLHGGTAGAGQPHQGADR